MLHSTDRLRQKRPRLAIRNQSLYYSKMTSNGTHHDAVNGSAELVIPLQINGQDIKTGTTLDVVDPSTGNVVWKSSASSKQDALHAVEAANAAFPAWSRTKPAMRRDILLQAADILALRRAELVEYMVKETGASEVFAVFNILLSVELLKDVAGRIITISGSVPLCGVEGRNAIVYKEPYGVVLGIAPWYGSYVIH